MLPRLGSKLVTNWIVVTLAASIIATLDGGWLARWGALAPSRIFHGELWRLVTWPLIETGPMGLVLTCLAIYKFGGELAVRWGDRRLQRYIVQIIVAAAIVTSVLAMFTGKAHVWRLGGWAVADVLVIAWARQFPDRALVLYGLVTLRGRALINMTVGITALFALYFGPVEMAPELAACAFAFAYPRSWLRR